MGHGALRQYLAGSIASLGFMVTGTALGWPSPTLVKIQETNDPMPLNDEEKSWMVSLLYIGNFISPIPAGYLMDKYGRKKTVIVLSVIPLTAWIFVLIAKEPYMLYLSRFLNGLWSGISYTIITMYLGEISEPSDRGALSTLIQLMTYVGVFYEYVIGPFVSYMTLGIMNAILPVIYVFLYISMPESPYWYMMHGRHEDARHSLYWLRDAEHHHELDEELDHTEKAVKHQMENKKTYSDLVASKGHRKELLIVEVLAICQRLSGISGLMAYTSITLPKEGIDPQIGVILMGSVWITSVFVSTALVDVLGRKPLLIASSTGSGIAMGCATVWFYLRYKTNIFLYNTYWAPCVFILIYGAFFSIGLGPIASTVQGEMFPTNTKGLASAITTISLSVTSFVMNKIYLTIADDIGMYFNFFIFSISCFLCLLFVIFFVIETKGKTLEEIQDELENKSRMTLVSRSISRLASTISVRTWSQTSTARDPQTSGARDPQTSGARDRRTSGAKPAKRS